MSQIKFGRGWTIGKILLQHRFPIIGILYTPVWNRYWSVSTTLTWKYYGHCSVYLPPWILLNSYVDWASGLLIYAQFGIF